MEGDSEADEAEQQQQPVLDNALPDSLPTNGNNDTLEPTLPDTRMDNERMEADLEADEAEQQQQPVLDNALPANHNPSVDDGEEFYLDETSGSWIMAQEKLNLVRRGPKEMGRSEEHTSELQSRI